MKDFLERLKNDQKTQAAVICSVVGAVLVLAAAVTIPVALHNRVKVEADAESAAITAEAAVTESASASVTEPETEAVSEITTEPTTAETTAQAASNNAGKNTPVDTNKGGSADKNSGSDSSAKKPNSGSNGGQVQQKPPVVEQPNKKNRGLVIDSSLNEKGISWSSPIDTRLDYKSNAPVDLHYQIDRFYNFEVEDFGCVSEKSRCNIFSINYDSYWEIYVVY